MIRWFTVSSSSHSSRSSSDNRRRRHRRRGNTSLYSSETGVITDMSTTESFRFARWNNDRRRSSSDTVVVVLPPVPSPDVVVVEVIEDVQPAAIAAGNAINADAELPIAQNVEFKRALAEQKSAKIPVIFHDRSETVQAVQA